MTPHTSHPETEWLAEVDAGKQTRWLNWPTLRGGFKARGTQALAWLKVGLKHVLIAAYIGLLVNIALTFAGF